MDFTITSDLAVVRNQQITANFEAVSAWLDEELKPYLTMAVTHENIPTAKAHRAAIRKVKERIETYRKEAKAAALVPYNDFEAKVKVLTGKLDEAANALDEQIKADEEAERQEKIDGLKALYDTAPAEIREYCPWDCVFNARWGNKGYSVQDASKEIEDALTRTASDLASIRGMGGDDTAYLLDVYKQTRDLSAVLRKKEELRAAMEREAERKRREAEAKPVETPKPVPMPATEEKDDPLVTVDFRVTCRKSELAGLGGYMKAHGIKYGRAG